MPCEIISQAILLGEIRIREVKMNKFKDSVKPSVLNINPYVPGKPIEEVQRELGLKSVIKLASNENPLGPSKKAVAAIKKEAMKVSLYPDSACFNLRRALSRHLKTAPETLILGNGSNELEQLIAETFVKPGDEVLFSALSFVVYPIVTEIAGGTAVQVPHKDFRHDMVKFSQRLNGRTKLVFICNPNNPTGTIITKAEFEAFMEKAAAAAPHAIVVLDEAYFEYVSDKNYPDGTKYLSKYPNLIVLRTFSKIYGLAGTRVGYGITSPEIAGYIDRVRAPFNVNMLAQSAALAALSDKEHVKKTVKLNNDSRKYMYAQFKKLGIEYVESQANFIFVKFRIGGKVMFERLMKEGVIIRPQFENYARITTGTMKENEKLIKAIIKTHK